MTLGEQRIRTIFNPSSLDLVDKIKQSTAQIIDLMQELKKFENTPGTNNNAQFKFSNSPEQLRLISLAQTEYENACMWAIKAITF